MKKGGIFLFKIFKTFHNRFNLFYLWNEQKRLKKEVEQYQYMMDECEQEIQRLNNRHSSTLSIPSLSEPDAYIELKVGEKLHSFLKNSDTFYTSFRELRNEIANRVGFILPEIDFSSSPRLDDWEYEVSIKGVCLLKTVLIENALLAISTPLVLSPIKGIPAGEDLVGDFSWWIDQKEQQHVEALGYYCLRAEEVIVTNLTYLLDQHLYRLIDRSFVLTLFDECDYNWASQSELDHLGIRPFTVQQVLQELVKQQVSIRNISMIFECMIRYQMNQPVELMPLHEIVTYVKEQLGNK